MLENNNKVTALTDEELMDLAGGFIETSAAIAGAAVLLYAVRPMPFDFINLFINIFKK